MSPSVAAIAAKNAKPVRAAAVEVAAVEVVVEVVAAAATAEAGRNANRLMPCVPSVALARPSRSSRRKVGRSIAAIASGREGTDFRRLPECIRSGARPDAGDAGFFMVCESAAQERAEDFHRRR